MTARRAPVEGRAAELQTDAPRFAMVPEWVIYDSRLNNAAVRMYAALARHADNSTHQCFPSRDTLAQRLGWSINTVDRALQMLEEAGALVARRRWLDQQGRATFTQTLRATSTLYLLAFAPPPSFEDTATPKTGGGTVSPMVKPQVAPPPNPGGTPETGGGAADPPPKTGGTPKAGDSALPKTGDLTRATTHGTREDPPSPSLRSGEPAPAEDPNAFASGIDPDALDDPPEGHPSEFVPGTKATRDGRPLNPDWLPDPKLNVWTLAEIQARTGATEAEARKLAGTWWRDFRAHFLGPKDAAAKGPRKRSWRRTWQRWVRTESDSTASRQQRSTRPANGGRGLSPQAAGKTTQADVDSWAPSTTSTGNAPDDGWSTR